MSSAAARTWILLGVIAAATACGGTTEVGGGPSPTPTPTPRDTVPSSVTVVGATTLTAVAGSQLSSPITAVVKNKAGDPLSGVHVAFTPSGNGQVSAPGVNTDAQGSASTNWILGTTAGTQNLTIAVQGTSAVVVQATATAGAAASVTKIAGDAQSAAIGTAVAVAPAVKVTDQYGNPVQGVSVVFQVSSGGGTVSGGFVNTGADGIARAGSWTLGNSLGANTLTAIAGNLPTSAVFSATAIVGAPAVIRFASSAAVSLAAGQTAQVTATAYDAGNNQLTTVPSYSSSNTGIATVDANGTVTGISVGTATITASIGSVSATRLVFVVGHPQGIVSDTIPLGGQPLGVAVGAAGVFVAQPLLNQITVFSPAAAQLGVVPTANAPSDVAVAAAGSIGVVANQGANQMGILDLTSRSQVDAVSTTVTPLRVALTSDGSRAIAVNSGGQAFVVDVATRTIVATVNLNGTPVGVVIAPGDTLAYAATQQGILTRIDVRSGARLAQVTGTTGMADIGVSPDGATLYVANSGTSQIEVYDASTLQRLSRIDALGVPFALAVSPDGQQLYVSQPALQRVLVVVVIGGRGLVASKLIGLPGTPQRIAFDRSGTFAVVSNQNGRVDFIR